MTRPQVTLEDLQRLLRHLPDEADVDLIILKGHLLVEESLERIIRTIVAHGDLLGDMRLSFAQKAVLARAMCSGQHKNKLWDLILSLNSLRNDLAHQLEPPKFDDKLKRFLAAHLAEYADAEKWQETIRSAGSLEQLRYAIALLMGFLGSYERDAAAYRKKVDAL